MMYGISTKTRPAHLIGKCCARSLFLDSLYDLMSIRPLNVLYGVVVIATTDLPNHLLSKHVGRYLR